MNNSNYVPLEQKTVSQISQISPGASLGFNASSPTDLFQTTSFLYVAAIMAIVLVAAQRYMLAGIWRIQASEASITKSNKEISRVTWGLVLVLSLFVILYTFNKGLLKGDVGLEGLRANTKAGGGVAAIVPGGGGNFGGGGASGDFSPTCDTKEATISKLNSPGGFCGASSCSALTGCAFQQYLTIINNEASRQVVDPKLVIAIMCKESKGKKDISHQNPDGTYDCGLMQINQPSQCTPASYDPATNIATGITKLKRAIASANQTYQNIPLEARVAANYNCCSNGTIPNAESVDCTQASGFPYTIPKWACPINPGTSQYNMCSVRSYACEVSACVKLLSGGDL